MSSADEKKWFIYLGDHHEGPFSVSEVKVKLARSQITDQHYVWAEGMPDWIPLRDISELTRPPEPEPVITEAAPEVRLPERSIAPQSTEADSTSETIEISPIDLGNVTIAQVSEEKTSELETIDREQIHGTGEGKPSFFERWKQKRLLKKEQKQNLQGQQNEKKSQSDQLGYGGKGSVVGGTSPRRRTFRLFLVLLFVGLGAYAFQAGYLNPVLQSSLWRDGSNILRSVSQPVLVQLAEWIPALESYVSPIPFLKDVNEEDLKGMRAAASADPHNGYKLGIGLKQSTSSAPVFYVAGNVPDGTMIDLVIEGVEGTLLNRLSFLQTLKVRVNGKLGSSGKLLDEYGKPISQGSYLVYAVDSTDQPTVSARTALDEADAVKLRLPRILPPNRKAFAVKSFFLGGEKDDNYRNRLRIYHDKVREKAKAELLELKQFANTMMSQFSTSNSQYTQLRKGKKNSKKMKVWQGFHKKWSGLNSQLQQAYEKWTPQSIEKDYFYGSLFKAAKMAAEQVSQMHFLHHSYFTQKVDTKLFEVQRNEAVAEAERRLTRLSSEIKRVEQLPSTASGLPRRPREMKEGAVQKEAIQR